MRVAILTLPLHTNYGGILQCYALQTVLQRMGHDVKVLTKLPYGISYYWIYPLAVCKRIIKRYILGKDVDILRAPHEIIRKNTDRFIREYIKKYNFRNWNSEMSKKFDAIIVGSDQIWRPEYFQPIEYAFLSFLGNSKIRRISYAASFGVEECEFTEEQLKICSSLLKKFDAVSVREYTGIEFCNKNFGVDALQMLDPTLLLIAEDYRTLINKTVTKPPKGNMLVYIIDKTDEKVDLVNKIAKNRGMMPFWLDSPSEQNNDIPLKKQVKMSVEQWLRSFDEAEFVFTDSFHGCIFSMIFRKQFLAISNKGRGNTRFNSLLGMFSLTDRLINSDNYDEILHGSMNCEINYEKIFADIEKQRLYSLDFLNRNLSLQL